MNYILLDNRFIFMSVLLNSQTITNLESYGLKANRISWEDTARTKNSCWGPNISDMTLSVNGNLCPMIRKPNFTDVTYDLPISYFNLLTGNESGEPTKVVPLKEKLQELGLYLDRDEVILTSAQTCLLPCEEGKSTNFCVQLYNYQSYTSNPAVLTILVSNQGTSIQTLSTNKDKLYFNYQGNAYDFKAERLADIRTKRTGVKQQAVKKVSEMNQQEKQENVLMIFQVPLKQKPPQTRGGFTTQFSYAPEENEEEDEEESVGKAGGMFCGSDSDSDSDYEFKTPKQKKAGVDMAVLSLGEEKGKYKGYDTELVRDERYPIRCTFQYYRVTDDVNIEESVIQDIKHTLDNLEKKSIDFGSLVTSGETDRKTETLRIKTPTFQAQPTPDWNGSKMVSFL